jgi:predicted DNA-binding ribbon-helix-helix protein
MASALPGPALGSDDRSRTEKHSALVMRNISVLGRRTSIRLEPQIWDTLAEICRREFCTTHDVCSYVAGQRPPHGSLASSLRIFILSYFHTCATEDGHQRAGHGQGMFLVVQEELKQMRASKADLPERERPEGFARSPLRTRSGPGPD